MKECGLKKVIWFIVGAAALLALVAPLIYAILRVDRTPGLVIDRERAEK